MVFFYKKLTVLEKIKIRYQNFWHYWGIEYVPLCYPKVQNVIKWINPKKLSKKGLFQKTIKL